VEAFPSQSTLQEQAEPTREAVLSPESDQTIQTPAETEKEEFPGCMVNHASWELLSPDLGAALKVR
jgi:hypothetical protein